MCDKTWCLKKNSLGLWQRHCWAVVEETGRAKRKIAPFFAVYLRISFYNYFSFLRHYVHGQIPRETPMILFPVRSFNAHPIRERRLLSCSFSQLEEGQSVDLTSPRPIYKTTPIAFNGLTIG